MRPALTLDDLASAATAAGASSAVREVWEGFLPHLRKGCTLTLREGLGSSSRFADIYAIRARHLQDIGWENGGFGETVRELEQQAGGVRVISLETREYHALCFLTPDLSRMVGFIYVKKPLGEPEPDLEPPAPH